MRSHGHGQGYLDLNFLIPELVERIDYRKGPYFADVGDFSLAGTAAFRTYDRLPRPFAEVTTGEFGYYRALAAGSGDAFGGDLLLALDGTVSNGPWVLDEDLERLNGLAKFSRNSGDANWSVGATFYHAHWTSTDQVPLRAVESGLIDRLGFVDPDLGGRTTRAGLNGRYRAGGTNVAAYAVAYDFRLTSNFTYFLDDPVNGDEFQQGDRRTVLGGAFSHRADAAFGGMAAKLLIGGDARYDRIARVGLYRSVGGERTATVREDRIDEYSLGLFAEAELALAPEWRAIIGLRGDFYGYDVDAGLSLNSGDGGDAILQPKAALAWRPVEHLELYASYGEGFHSNDVRGAAIAIDPVSGDPADPVPLLVRGRGAELGARVEYPGFNAALSLFRLSLDSELVFVGDAGGTEPSDASRRYGAEASLFWQPVAWMALDASAALTHARFRGVPDDRIPNAVSEVFAAGATVEAGNGLSAAMRVRHFGPAPLIEDGSVRSGGTTLVNLGAQYQLGRIRIARDIFNLFDAREADITYFYRSRLAGEPTAGVDDIHFHPVEPRQARASLRYSF